MPSPIAHLAAGYGIYSAFRRFDPEHEQKSWEPVLLAASLGLSLVPDLDSVLGIIGRDFGRFHNNFTHSPFFGLIFTCGFATAIWAIGNKKYRRWFWLALTCIMVHILMDYLTWGRGVMLLWPWTEQRFQPPLLLFYGLRWSDGWLSIHHLWTMITEIGFAVLVVLCTRARPKN